MTLHTYGSMFLIGMALTLSAVVGVLQPPGHRSGALLALLAGTGVGISALALSWSAVETGRDDEFLRAFFNSSIAGFVTVVAVLTLAWLRARPQRGVSSAHGS
jgi:hypothetical protein